MEKDRRLIPNAIGKEIEFQSASTFEGEHFLHIQLSDGKTYVMVSKSPIEVYEDIELED
ncbi:hypothetical protein [Bacillus infantis]|uniref:hypothetical protein n=1 Tax=Bacillus infantis TaxID=324767 RepID=UPI003CF1D540